MEGLISKCAKREGREKSSTIILDVATYLVLPHVLHVLISAMAVFLVLIGMCACLWAACGEREVTCR